MTPPASALGEAAVAYAAAGYEVFPLRGKLPHGNCPACEPRAPAYQPHPPTGCGHELCHGLYAATTDPTRVAAWWARWPAANVGARVPRGLFVLDVDPRAGGLDALARLEAEHGALPPTRTSLSGRGDGGAHRWFVHPGGPLSVAALRRGGYRGVDLKTHHGYVVLPPSRHPATGKPYTWAEPVLDPAEPPAWLCRLLAPPPTPAAVRRSLPRPARGGSVADWFTARTSWAEVLGPHGWTSPDPHADADGARWRHPDASNPKSATVRHGLLFVYSAATPFEATEPGAPHGYTRFRAYALLEHGGDLSAAARALRAEAGR
jgi:Bifunctional DNA primase/polymerase, N-terminal